MNKILFAFLAVALNVFSQDIEVKKGDTFKGYSGESDIIGTENENLIIVNYSYSIRGPRKPDAFIHRLDDELNIISSKEVFTIEPTDDILRIFYFNKSYQVFFQRFNKSNKTSTLYAGELDDKFNVSEQIKKIYEVSYEASVDGKKPFSIECSTDSSFYLIECFNISQNYTTSFVRLNKKLEIVQTTESVPISYKDEAIDYLLTDSGDLYYTRLKSLVIKRKEKEDPIEIKLNHSDKLYVVDSKILHVEKTEFIYVLQLVKKDKKDRLSSSFNFFEKSIEHREYSTGYVWYKIDRKTQNVIDTNQHFFSEKLMNSILEFNDSSGVESSSLLNKIKIFESDEGTSFTVCLSNIVNIHTQSEVSFHDDDFGQDGPGVYYSNYYGSLILNLNSEGGLNWYDWLSVRQFASLAGEFQELFFWTSNTLKYFYTNRLVPEKLIIVEYNKAGDKIKRTEVHVRSGIVYLNPNEFISNDRVVVCAIDKQGLFKAKAYFMELKY